MKNDKRTVKIGEHRGGPRLWLEGKWLHEAGFERGMQFLAVVRASQLVLALDKDGNRKVSGKAGGKSVIDMALREDAAELLSAGSVGVVTIEDGKLVITLDKAETLARHRAEDPHCSCSDCIDALALSFDEGAECEHAARELGEL
jgi:DNA (cytosine-5)-methyltransferase 1